MQILSTTASNRVKHTTRDYTVECDKKRNPIKLFAFSQQPLRNFGGRCSSVHSAVFCRPISSVRPSVPLRDGALRKLSEIGLWLLWEAHRSYHRATQGTHLQPLRSPLPSNWGLTAPSQNLNRRPRPKHQPRYGI